MKEASERASLDGRQLSNLSQTEKRSLTIGILIYEFEPKTPNEKFL